MTGSKRRAGRRRGPAALLVAIAATAVTAFGASSAQATTQSVDMHFDHGLLKLGGSASPIDIVGDSEPQPHLNADVCTDTSGGCTAVGNFTVTIAHFDFPQFTSDVSGVPGETATVDLIPLVNVTGNYNVLTGTLTTNASNYQSTVGLAGPIAAHCLVSPINLAFSTGKNTPFIGDAFDAQANAANPQPPLNGVIDADWATLPTPADDPAQPGDDSSTCASVLKVFTDGPGGVGLGNGIEPVLVATPPSGGGATTPPPVKNTAGLKKCKKKAKKIKDPVKRKKALKKCKKKFG
jgi:hypothetical protein